MNIAIIILSIIDSVFIYYSGIKNELFLMEVLKDVLGTVILYLFYYRKVDEDEKVIVIYKWVIFFITVLSLLIILINTIKNGFTNVNNCYLITVPFCLTYFILLIKKKLEDNYII